MSEEQEHAQRLADIFFDRKTQAKGWYNAFAVAIIDEVWSNGPEAKKVFMTFGQQGDGQALNDLGIILDEAGEYPDSLENVYIYMDIEKGDDLVPYMMQLDEWWEKYGKHQDYEDEDLGKFAFLLEEGGEE